MGDSEKPIIPAWQQANAEAEAPTSEPENITIERARQFLKDETVKTAAPEEKRQFLKSKGLDDSQITQLLDEPLEESQSSPSQSAEEPSTTATPEATPEDHKTDARPDTQEVSLISIKGPSSEVITSTTIETLSPPPSSTIDSPPPPPIITYPEFLTKPQRPPPLITPSRLANLLAASGGVWALLYGISGLAIKPMVDNLNEARSDYYDHVNTKLSRLVEKLESTVSEVPYKNGKPLKSQQHGREIDDNESTTSDPTELFHRDVGTQTSPPPSINGSNAGNNSDKPVDVQARHLAAISASIRELTLMHTQKAEGNADLRSVIEEVRDQANKYLYPPVQSFSVYGGLGYDQSSEANDEFKNAKDAIRSVKGLFLSSRSFPAVTTR